MQSEGPGFRQWPDESDHALPRGVTKRRSRVTFASPPSDERPLTELPATRQLIKPATYYGSGPWQDYHALFEACTEISGWRYNQKGLYLAVSIRGSAQGVLGNFPKGSKPDYQTLVRALEERFAPLSQTEPVPSTNVRAPSKSWRVSPRARSSHSSTCKFGIPYRPNRNKRDSIQRPVCGRITGL